MNKRRQRLKPQSMKVNGNSGFMSLLLCVLMFPFSLLHAIEGDNLKKHEIPSNAITLSYHPELQILAACLTFGGLSLHDATSPDLEGKFYPDWHAMHALPMDEGRFILADRFGYLRLIKQANGLEFEELASWKTEGIPNHLQYKEGVLAVAAGGAGLLLYEWDGTTTEPILRGRFPFTDYTKTVRFFKDNVAFIADNFDTGIQAIEVSDIMKPRKLWNQTWDYIDYVALNEELLVVSGRQSGSFLIDINDPTDPILLGVIELNSSKVGDRLTAADGVIADFLRRTHFVKDDLLLTIETRRASLVELSEKTDESIVTIQKATIEFADTQLLDGFFLPDGRVVISTVNQLLYVWTPEFE